MWGYQHSIVQKTSVLQSYCSTRKAAILLLFWCFCIHVSQTDERYIRTRPTPWNFYFLNTSYPYQHLLLCLREFLISLLATHLLTQKISILFFHIQEVETMHIAFIYFSNCKYLTKMAWDILSTHHYWIPCSEPPLPWLLFAAGSLLYALRVCLGQLY